jgi:hypothetical protein
MSLQTTMRRGLAPVVRSPWRTMRWQSSSADAGDVIGIDLGTTNSCVCIMVGNSIGCWLFVCLFVRSHREREKRHASAVCLGRLLSVLFSFMGRIVRGMNYLVSQTPCSSPLLYFLIFGLISLDSNRKVVTLV